MVLSDPPLMPFWAWSTLLHVGVITVFSIIHFTKTIEHEFPVLQVTLVDSSATEPASESAQSTPQKAKPNKTPPPHQAQRSVTPRPQPVIPTQQPLDTLVLQTPIPHIVPPVTPQEKTLPVQRKVLLDHRASTHLQIKQYFKVVQRTPVPRKTAKPTTRHLDVVASSTGLPTYLPTRPSTSLTSLATPSIHPSVTPQVLKATVPGSGNISKSRVGLGRTIPPIYPRIARKSGWEGTVLIRVAVQSDGNPDSISIQRSSGFTVLDNAAMDAIKKWEFLPAKDGNIPIRSVVDIPINFDLRQEG